MIIYPAVDIRMGQCVRLEQGDFQRGMQVAESPVQAAKNWQQQGAEWIHVVDLDGARAGYPCNLARVAEIAQEVAVPLQLGGGIRTEQHIEEVLEAGVSRVILGTQALQDPQWVARMVQTYPKKILAGIDARLGKVAVRGWYEDTEETVMAVASRMMDAGVSEIIYTDIHKDGMLQGPDLAGLTALLQAGIPVIASGGVSSQNDLYQLKELEAAGLSGVIIGKALYSRKLNLKDALAIMTSEAGEQAC